MNTIFISGEKNKIYTHRGVENYVHADTWVKTADQTWQHRFEGIGVIGYCAFDDASNLIPRSKTPELGKWYMEANVLTVMSDLQPDVYYGTKEKPCVFIENSSDITLDLTCRYGFAAVRVINSRRIRLIVEGDHLGRGISCENSSIIVDDVSFHKMGDVAIGFGGNCNGSEINKGISTYCGMSQGMGTVYGAHCSGSIVTQQFVAAYQQHGNYWNNGSTFFADNYTDGMSFIECTSIGSKIAIHDNSGNGKNYFINHKSVNCEVPRLLVTDSQKLGTSTPVEIGTNVI